MAGRLKYPSARDKPKPSLLDPKTPQNVRNIAQQISELLVLSGHDRRLLEEINHNLTYRRPLEEVIKIHFEVTDDRQDKIRRFAVIAWLQAYLTSIGSDIKVSGYWKYTTELKKILSDMGAVPSVLAGVSYYRKLKFKGRLDDKKIKVSDKAKVELRESRRGSE